MPVALLMNVSDVTWCHTSCQCRAKRPNFHSPPVCCEPSPSCHHTVSPFSGLSPGCGSAVASVCCLAGAALIFIQIPGDAAMYYAPRVTAATVVQGVHSVSHEPTPCCRCSPCRGPASWRCAAPRPGASARRAWRRGPRATWRACPAAWRAAGPPWCRGPGPASQQTITAGACAHCVTAGEENLVWISAAHFSEFSQISARARLKIHVSQLPHSALTILTLSPHNICCACLPCLPVSPLVNTSHYTGDDCSCSWPQMQMEMMLLQIYLFAIFLMKYIKDYKSCSCRWLCAEGNKGRIFE